MLKKDKIRSRLGEERTNNFGSKMVIKEYRNSKDIDVYFPQYNWMTKNKEYQNFKRGNIKCPYEPRIYGWVLLEKENIRLKKMVNIRKNMIYITTC